jgi:hypothetical protein
MAKLRREWRAQATIVKVEWLSFAYTSIGGRSIRECAATTFGRKARGLELTNRTAPAASKSGESFAQPLAAAPSVAMAPA